MSFPKALLLIALAYWPVAVIAGLGFLWAHKTSQPRLRRLLRRTCGFWAVALMLFDIAFVITLMTCGGNALYGFAGCTLIPTAIANMSLLAFLLIHTIAALCILALVIIGALWEWRATAAQSPFPRRADPPKTTPC